MTVRVSHTLADLERDAKRIPVKAARGMAKAVRNNAKAGNRLAARNAKESAGSHGKHYHRAFTAEALSPLEWEYGPDASKPQGGMSFEYGSRNQAPHMDLNKSADVYGYQLRLDVMDLAKDLFW